MIATIQHRRGPFDEFDKTKMLPAEFAVVLSGDPDVPSGKALYLAFASGDVHRLISIEDLEEMVRQDVFKGPKGDKGDRGEQGEQGEKGDTGDKGEKGDTGVGITDVDIDSRGHLMLTMSDGTEKDAGLIDDALALIDEAVQSAKNAAQSASEAEKAQTDAQAAQKAIENLGVAASNLPAGSDATVEKSVADTGVTLHFGIPRGEQGATGPRGEQGIAGPQGPEGPPGESGVTVPLAGLFTLSVDDDGNLWAYYADTETPPPFEYDETTGELYYNVPEA